VKKTIKKSTRVNTWRIVTILFMTFVLIANIQASRFTDDFEDDSVDTRWNPGGSGVYTFIEQNGTLQINYSRSSDNSAYEAFVFWPSEKIDVSAYPQISMKIKSDVEFSLALKPSYSNDDNSDNFATIGTVPGDGEWNTYTLELKEENYANDSLYELLFFFDPGFTGDNKEGVIYFDDFAIAIDTAASNDIPFPIPSEMIAKMGKGVNMGNTFDVKEEWRQNWGEHWIEEYKDAGFQTIRIPVGWGSEWCPYTETTPPYTIDEDWLNTIQQAVDWVLDRGMCAIINSHHDDWVIGKGTEGWDDPYVKARFDSIWAQISRRFKGYPPELIFEIYNEPTNTEFDCSDGDCMDQANLDDMNQTILNTIRKTNPKRYVIYGGLNWSKWYTLMEAAIPEDSLNDPSHVIGTYHYYEPYNFTHKGNGTTYLSRCSWGTAEDIANIDADFDEIAQWAENNNLPLFVGEYGPWNNDVDKPCGTNDRTSVLDYVGYVSNAAFSRGMAYSYWGDGGWHDLGMRTSGQWDTAKVNRILLHTATLLRPVSDISITPSSLTLEVGDTTRLIATISPSDAFDQGISWESDKPSVAKVDSNGMVTALHEGTAIITATTVDGGYSSESTITVNPVGTFVNNLDHHTVFKVYPNPTTGEININGNDKYSIDIYNIQGIKLRAYTGLEDKETLNVQGLASGMYLLHVQGDNIQLKRVLIIK